MAQFLNVTLTQKFQRANFGLKHCLVPLPFLNLSQAHHKCENTGTGLFLTTSVPHFLLQSERPPECAAEASRKTRDSHCFRIVTSCCQCHFISAYCFTFRSD